MASTVWKGYITFGLISIPIRLFAAARSEHVSFNQLHEVCKTRIRQQLYCPTCDRVVERSEIAKGYPVGKNRYVLVEPEELRKIAPASTDTMEILQFVRLDEIDPLYFDASYYAVPEEPGRRAYQLLLRTMEESGYAAIAKIGMHQREYTVVLRPRDRGLTLHTIYYPEEVREVPGYGADTGIDVRPQEMELARQLVNSLAGPFDPSRFRDEYQARVQALIEAKREGRGVEEAPAARPAPVIDLMEALQKSLASRERKPPARAGERTAATRRRKDERKAG
ncbi:MAG: Ku protein [Bryobacteraceae bacterium]